MKTSLVAAALLLATGGMASAQSDAVQRDAAQRDAEAKEEKKICRTDRATGSLTRRTRVCMTRAEWREFNSRTYRGVSEMQGEGSGSRVCEYENSSNICY